MELKKRLLELDVDEDYIDKNNEFIDDYYNKYIHKYSKNNIYVNHYDKTTITRSNPINIKNNKIYSISIENNCFKNNDKNNDNYYNHENYDNNDKI